MLVHWPEICRVTNYSFNEGQSSRASDMTLEAFWPCSRSKHKAKGLTFGRRPVASIYKSDTSDSFFAHPEISPQNWFPRKVQYFWSMTSKKRRHLNWMNSAAGKHEIVHIWREKKPSRRILTIKSRVIVITRWSRDSFTQNNRQTRHI